MDKKSSIDTFLVRTKILKDTEVPDLVKVSQDSGEALITTIIKFKKLNPESLAVSIAKQFGIPYLDLDYLDTSVLPEDIDLTSLDKYKALIIKKSLTSLTVVVSDPTVTSLQDLKFQSNVNNVHLVVANDTKLNRLIKRLIDGAGGKVSDASELLDEESPTKTDDDKKENAEVEDAPIVKFIHGILLDAIRLKASDIHFEPYEKTYRVRFRIDGELISQTVLQGAGLKEKIASRIKVISQMDISEKRIPQDGRMKLPLGKDKAIDFRVSSLPTLFGEKIVMRILDSSSASLDIDKLGYDKEQKDLLLEAVARPYGMVLVTGPTGSGKTVSLYSCLNVINKDNVNICTAEDPAEIQLPGINQVNMNDKAGLTFASALKSFLRQDPDVILVGEIRDLETADIAIKAAQTGHMVLSTLHTNDAPKTIARLLNMGVKPFNIASSVNLITAQRLARRLCNCKQKDESVTLELLIENGLPQEEIEGYGTKWHVYKPVGCGDCNEKGYKGRVGIYQVMPITEEIKKIILREGTEIEIAAESRAAGVYSLREAGLVKVKKGITSLSEVLATTNLD